MSEDILASLTDAALALENMHKRLIECQEPPVIAMSLRSSLKHSVA